MNDEIAYFLFYFFTQRETGEEDYKPDWRSWETLSTWHTSTQDVRSCQSTTIFSMTVSPFCTESAHVWIAWRALCSSLLCSFHLLCLLSFRARLMLGFVCQPTRWGSHPGRWQRKGNSRQEPFLNMALAGVQRPTCVETSGDIGPGQNWKWRWKQSIGKPVHSLPHQPHVCTNTIWPQHLKMTVMNVNKGYIHAGAEDDTALPYRRGQTHKPQQHHELMLQRTGRAHLLTNNTRDELEKSVGELGLWGICWTEYLSSWALKSG